MHDKEDKEKLIRLETLFSRLFRFSERTVLVRATTSDPVFFPQCELREYAEIHFANDFFSSALHEIAHWLIAGRERRNKLDYGYWYKPDGRDQLEQAHFEKFEARNQGLEWILSVAADHEFHISADNLNGDETCCETFARAIQVNALAFIERGFEGRIKTIVEALIAEFGNDLKFTSYWARVKSENLLPQH
jgi:elongation factor P hydroxylase